ncbi:uncharacterized protein LOC110463626 isoform X2 [Mizuhopecten yessoensis]|uniref:uncharacterized protein LOC110463626 isoform X2 n=1 Tax=Mizuhopecten yessoensis TaxID=6573 RepID=UPI000B4571A7|nr:uncharacterized protein LOC110463626 isoform X2 [Mizuhopecten yessoensis]
MAGAATTRVFRFPLYLFLWSYIGVFVNGVGGSWTIWYNRLPDDIGDDQSWTTIKNHGYTVCGTEKPELAECRVVGSDESFTERNAGVIAPDYLSEPCTKDGLVCYNYNANNRRCHDYEVRFFCPYTDTDDKEERSADYGLVALAAGLSVLIPLLCVVVLQCIRQVRVKRALRARSQAARDHFSNLRSEPVDPTTFTSPPTYESLFSNGQSFPTGTGRDALLQSETTNSSSVDLSHVNEGFSHDDSTQTGIYQISTGSVLPTDTGSRLTNLQRFPGMHLSIEDIILLNSGSQRTPPPAYNDAMVIVGPIPPKYSDVQKEQVTPET